MIPRPDAQSYTRFLISLGVFLCIAALVAPALVIRETAVFRVSAKELAGMTQTARGEIERRQRVSRTAGVYAPYAGGVLLLGGLAMIAFGIPRLRKQEGVSDQLSAAQLTEALAPQTPAERHARLQESLLEERGPEFLFPPDWHERRDEAHPLAPQDADPNASEAPESTAAPTEDHERATPRLNPLPLRETALVEQRVLNKLRSIAPAHYEVRTQVRLSGPPDLYLDVLWFTEMDRPADVVIEIKVYKPNTSGLVLGTAATQANEAVRAYTTRTGRPALGWLIIVTTVPATLPIFTYTTVGGLDVTLVEPDEIDRLTTPRSLVFPDDSRMSLGS
jgi:hypothetical protein